MEDISCAVQGEGCGGVLNAGVVALLAFELERVNGPIFVVAARIAAHADIGQGSSLLFAQGRPTAHLAAHRNADIRTFNGLPHQQRAIPSLLAPYHRISMFFQRRLLYSSLPRSSNSLSRQ